MSSSRKKGQSNGINFVNVSHRSCPVFIWAYPLIEQNISPEKLTLLGQILNKCQTQPQRILGKALLQSASSLGDIHATVALLARAMRMGTLEDAEYVSPIARIKTQALPPHSDPSAMTLLGRIYEAQDREDDALQLYKRVVSISVSSDQATSDPRNEQFISDALVFQGRILLRRNDKTGAHAAFRRAALEYDNADAYYDLAIHTEKGTQNWNVYMLKAAQSGAPGAAYYLGAELWDKWYNYNRSKQVDKAKEALAMSKEWLLLAARAGLAHAMINLALIIAYEGNVQSAERWVKLAEETNPEIAELAEHARTSWSSFTAAMEVYRDLKDNFGIF
jgi:tetratricopeptide (TPR) repeat protein